jgi:hypothetical protein
MEVLELLVRPSVLPFMIPIVAIIVGGAVAITKIVIKHRERMAKIEHGVDPDSPHQREVSSCPPARVR